jgi:hypothetical protein
VGTNRAVDFVRRRLLAVVFFALAAVVVVVNDATPAAVGTAAVLLLLAAISWAMTLGDLRGRVMAMKSFSFGGATAEFEAALAELPASGDKGSSKHDLAGLQRLLEAKLAYVAKHLLAERLVRVPDDGHGTPVVVEPAQYAPSFATIGSLEYDQLLTPAIAAVCRQLLTTSEVEFRGLSAEAQHQLLDEGSEVVWRFRGAVFQGLVTKTLTDRFKANVREIELGPQRGFAVAGAHGQALFVSLFDVLGSSASLSDTRKRMLALADDYRARIIVVPTLLNRNAPTGEEEAVRIIRFDQLDDVVRELFPKA